MKLIKSITSPFSSKKKSLKEDHPYSLKSIDEREKAKAKNQMYKQIEGLVDQLAGIFKFKSDKKSDIVEGLAQVSVNKGSISEDDVLQIMEYVEVDAVVQEQTKQKIFRQSNCPEEKYETKISQKQSESSNPPNQTLKKQKTDWSLSLTRSNVSKVLSKFKLSKAVSGIFSMGSKSSKQNNNLQQSTKESPSEKVSSQEYGGLRDEDSIMNDTLGNLSGEQKKRNYDLGSRKSRIQHTEHCEEIQEDYF